MTPEMMDLTPLDRLFNASLATVYIVLIVMAVKKVWRS